MKDVFNANYKTDKLRIWKASERKFPEWDVARQPTLRSVFTDLLQEQKLSSEAHYIAC